MTKPIHGHEVMKMMVEANTTYSVESLKTAINDKFGAEARFYTCSAENLTAEELIAFLEQRGKFIAQKEGFSTSADKICNH
jgi:probable metal-binding protein